MTVEYKGQFKMLCPYYVGRKEKSIQCVCPEENVQFGSKEETEIFMDHHCRFASPANCPRYMEHRRLVEEGLEKPKKPRESMDRSRREYHAAWLRKRRQDPTYKY